MKSFGIGAGAALLTAMALGPAPGDDVRPAHFDSQVPDLRVRREIQDELIAERLTRRLLCLARIEVPSVE